MGSPSPLLREITDQVNAIGHIAEETLEEAYQELRNSKLNRLDALCIASLGSLLSSIGLLQLALSEFSTGNLPTSADYVMGDWERGHKQGYDKAFSSEAQNVWSHLNSLMPGRLSGGVARMVATATGICSKLHNIDSHHPPSPALVPAGNRIEEILGPLRLNLASLTRTKPFVGSGSSGELIVQYVRDVVHHVENFCGLVRSS